MDPERRGELIRPTSSLPHVGRTAEQKAIRDALDLMTRGYGGLVLISGETGIGKTSLIDQARHSLPDGESILLAGHCYDLADALPYSPWRRMLQSAPEDSGLPALVERLLKPAARSPAGNQQELFELVTDALGRLAAQTPLVLVIEDIHWADYSSLELLRSVSHHASATAILIIASCRTDSADQRSHLAEFLPRLVRESNTRRIELQRLGLNDIRSLVTERYALSEADRERLTGHLYTRAEGNPLFTQELLRDLEARDLLTLGEDDRSWDLQDLSHVPVPGMVRQVIEGRIADLDEATLELLELAAVIGSRVPVDLWQAASGAPIERLIDAIQQAESREIVHETLDGRHLRFSHELVREAIYRRKPALQRRQQHRAVAETLCREPEPAPDIIAYHFALAGDERAVEWLIAAADLAERLHAAHEAISSVSSAIEIASSHRLTLPVRAYRIRARALESIGDADAAIQDFEQALRLSRDRDDLAGEWETLLDLGMLWSGTDYRQAGLHYEQALGVARAMNDERAIAQTLNRLGNWRANTGELSSAIALHRQALEIIERIGNPVDLLESHDLLGTTSFLAGDYRHALEYLEGAISKARALGDRQRLASALSMIPMFGGNLDINFSAGVASLRESTYWVASAEEGLEITREIDWKAGESFALLTLGMVVTVRGDPGLGLSLVDEGYAVARSIGHQQWLTLSSLALGLVWTELEDQKRAEHHLVRCRATADAIGSHLWRTLADVHLGRAYLRMDDVQRAAGLLSPYMVEESIGPSNAQRPIQLALAHLRLAEGDAQSALDYASGLLLLDESSATAGVPQVLRIKADALAALGRIQEADHTYRDGAEAADLLGLDAVRWRIHAAYSMFLASQGDIETATGIAEQAVETINAIAWTIPDVSVRDRFVARAMQSVPQPSERMTAAGVAGQLSDRELEVLTLAARGMSNGAVGERLFISPRTVAQHLQSIYRKLGVDSRTAAAAYAHEHDLI